MPPSPLGRPLDDWFVRFPLLRGLVGLEPTTWFNPALSPAVEALGDVGLTASDIEDAAARLRRFAPYLADAFGETRRSAGIIESPLVAIPETQGRLARHYGAELPGRLWAKLDSELPISGSIKARGGIHEVLQYAEEVAVEAGVLTTAGDYRTLASPDARALFARHEVAVGSTGNLGLSIGIMAATLGFRASVHMSADARAWKKDLLRARGVRVVEHAGDYSAAVASGRAEASGDPRTHFVDDENSVSLFLGYAVAARRLAGQLAALDVAVDADRPLFVYLPCGVGGGPGGVAFGLKTVFGDAVHCVFAEPTHAPCMLLGVLTGEHDRVSVQDFGIDNVTAADGLAVGGPSGFVGRRLRRLISGFYTETDEEFFRLIALLHEADGIAVEPSAAAGLPGPWRVLANREFRTRCGLDHDRLARATHLAWFTGGSMVPRPEMDADLARGAALLAGSAGTAAPETPA